MTVWVVWEWVYNVCHSECVSRQLRGVYQGWEDVADAFPVNWRAGHNGMFGQNWEADLEAEELEVRQTIG